MYAIIPKFAKQKVQYPNSNKVYFHYNFLNIFKYYLNILPEIQQFTWLKL